MLKQVIKRSGKRVSFNRNKIRAAIEKANLEVTAIEQASDDEIESIIHEVVVSHSEFSKKYAECESVHEEFERKTSSQIDEINKSMEKVQATLDIIVNLVTPFWKKW